MKRIKSLVCLLLATSCLLSATAFATDTQDANQTAFNEKVFDQIDASEGIEVADVQTLYNFADEPVAKMLYLDPIGYVIAADTGKVVQYSLEHNNEYFTDPSERYYYAGALSYYKKVDNDFVEIPTGKILQKTGGVNGFADANSTDDSLSFTSESFFSEDPDADYDIPLPADDQKVHTRGYNPDGSYTKQLASKTRLYDCNTDDNLPYFGVPKGTPGVCGSLALAVVTAYYDDHKDGTYCDDTKKNSGKGKYQQYGKDLVKEIVSYVEPGKGNATFLGGYTYYLQAHGIFNKACSGIMTGKWNKAVDYITKDCPVVVAINVAKKYDNHWVTVYGYKKNRDTSCYYMINNGYGSEDIVTVDAAFAGMYYLEDRSTT